MPSGEDCHASSRRLLLTTQCTLPIHRLRSGSTSLYWALHDLIDGRPRHKGRPYIHEFERWGTPGVSSATAPSADMLFHVYRDPVERYLSSFASKVMCCAGWAARHTYRATTSVSLAWANPHAVSALCVCAP